MNSFQIAEIVGVALIICCQVGIFVVALMRIWWFRDIFPPPESFGVTRRGLQKTYFDTHPRDLLANLDKYEEASKPLPGSPDERVFVDVIEITDKRRPGNRITQKIVYAINTYLVRNRGAASDFLLIKDVVERNTDVVENNIAQSVSLPLYLGLLGTFLGIVVGLFEVSGVNLSADDHALDNAISLLLGGVKIAMVASFAGLLLTVLHSGLIFKRAKSFVEERKNDFYTFIQMELLPVLNQNINTTLSSLQTNLHAFNEEFKGSINRLGSVMGKNYDALIAQERILNSLEKLDITEFAKANVVILTELKTSVEQLAQFNQYLGNMNQLVTSTGSVSASLSEMLSRTENLRVLGEKIQAMFTENQELVRFLQSHYDSLDNSRQLISRSVNEVGSVLDDSLVKLKEFTQMRIEEVQKITLKEIDLLQSQYPEKWKKLDNLGRLEAVDKNLADMKMATAAQIGSLTSEVKALLSELKVIRENSNNTFSSRISSLFRKKTGV